MAVGERAQFAAVFLDFGGTLFSYRGMSAGTRDLIAEAARRMGIAGEVRELTPSYRRASQGAYRAIGGRPYYLYRELFSDTYRRFARELGVEPHQDVIDWWVAAQRELVTGSFELRDDCIPTLRALRERGLRVCVVSNIDDDYLQPMIERAGLGELLHAWTSSEEAGSCKPDAQIYHLACEKAGCTPAQVLFVGDSPEQDVAGANGVGMTTALLREDGARPPGDGLRTPGRADHEIGRLGELLAIVEG